MVLKLSVYVRYIVFFFNSQKPGEVMIFRTNLAIFSICGHVNEVIARLILVFMGRRHPWLYCDTK